MEDHRTVVPMRREQVTRYESRLRGLEAVALAAREYKRLRESSDVNDRIYAYYAIAAIDSALDALDAHKAGSS